MNKFLITAALVGCCLAMPQGQGAGPPQGQEAAPPQGQSAAPKGNPYVRILNLESHQDGADFGHALLQEDGISSGQRMGPDGLLYGFYSYIQDDGVRVKVYYRAGKGVGYEVLKVEGLDITQLGNLKPTISATPYVEPPPRAATHGPRVLPIQPPVVFQQRVVVEHPQSLVPAEPTEAPHRFDYPAHLSLQRTATGFQSSFKAL